MGKYYTSVAAKGYLTATGGLDFVKKELLQTLYVFSTLFSSFQYMNKFQACSCNIIGEYSRKIILKCL